jgi:hypothetical protein
MLIIQSLQTLIGIKAIIFAPVDCFQTTSHSIQL